MLCVCTLLHAFQGALWRNKGGGQGMPQAAHQRVATFRLLDVPALAHELRFPIDLWRKSWTSDGGGGDVEASGPLAI